MPVAATESHRIAIRGEGIERVVGRRLISDHLIRSVEEDQMIWLLIHLLLSLVCVVSLFYKDGGG